MEEGIEKIGEKSVCLLQRKRSRFTTNTEENWGTGILLYPDKNGEYSTGGFRIWERYFMHSDVETAYLVHTADTKRTA